MTLNQLADLVGPWYLSGFYLAGWSVVAFGVCWLVVKGSRWIRNEWRWRQLRKEFLGPES